MAKWDRLIRFISEGQTYYGNALNSELKQATTIIGNPFVEGYIFGPVRPIHQLLSPIARHDARTVRLLGLNFRKHAAEAGSPLPEFPVIFHKPVTCIGGPYDEIPVVPMAQTGNAIDYEVELVVVIGKECSQVSKDQALSYVAGYTVGNDVSHRMWQFERGGGQWNVSKSFDGWAPLGPLIISASTAPSFEDMRLECRVNGELRQSELVTDMIFGVAEAIEFLSAGQTLLPGDLIFMGTPAGVGLGFKPEPKYLNHGDIVECSLTGVGTICNRVTFTKARF